MFNLQTIRHELTPTNEKMLEVVKFDGDHVNTKLAK